MHEHEKWKDMKHFCPYWFNKTKTKTFSLCNYAEVLKGKGHSPTSMAGWAKEIYPCRMDDE